MSQQRFSLRGAALLAVAALAGLPGLAAADNLVTNGSFETGAFNSGWTQTGVTAFNGVACAFDGFAPDGICQAYFGSLGDTGGIQQALATTGGMQYMVSFQLSGAGDNPSSVQVNFGAQTLLTLSNPTTSGFQTYSFVTTASGASTMLSFTFRDDADFIHLDNVSVTAVPEPATAALLSLGVGVLLMRRRRVD